MNKDNVGHIVHSRTDGNFIAAPTYHSVVKVKRAVITQNPNQKDARAHKNDLYFLNQLFKAYNVK